MTWNPRKKFLSAAPFRDNVEVAFVRDFDEALEWATVQCGIVLELDEDNEPIPLPTIGATDIYASRAIRGKYPVCNLMTLGNDPFDTDDDATQENIKLLVEFETAGRVSDDLIKVLEPYVLAGRSIIDEMTDEDWTAGLSGEREEMLIAISTERYGERTYDSEDTYTQVGSFVVTISYLEQSQA